VPALGALAADPLYSLVDTILVGHLGPRPLGALAIGTAAFTISFWVFSFLAFGVTPKVAMLLAAGDRDGAGIVGVQALLLALTMGAMVSIAGVLLAGPVVRGLGAGPEIAGLAEDYLRIRVLASIPVLLVTVGHGWLRGAHDTKTPMLIVTAGAVANAILDYVFIYPFGWGVAGAAWATVIGQTGAALAFVVVLRRRMRPPSWRWHGPSLRALLTVGAALVVRTGVLLGALTVATSAAARMGVVADRDAGLLAARLHGRLCCDRRAGARGQPVGRGATRRGHGGRPAVVVVGDRHGRRAAARVGAPGPAARVRLHRRRPGRRRRGAAAPVDRVAAAGLRDRLHPRRDLDGGL
jgi:putative MATE family efflux protein